MMIFNGKRIFFIGAHPDDIEIGCGALIANIQKSTEVFCITLSDNQENPLLKNVVRELYESMRILGVDEKHVFLENFKTRRFKHSRQEILEYLFSMNKRYQPDMVFVHSNADLHQDHGTATQESLRVFRGTSLFGYDVIRSSYGFFPTLLIEVNESDVEKKIEALAAYQTYKTKYYFSPELTRAIMIRNGAISEKKYAEGFEILRMIGTFA